MGHRVRNRKQCDLSNTHDWKNLVTASVVHFNNQKDQGAKIKMQLIQEAGMNFIYDESGTLVVKSKVKNEHRAMSESEIIASLVDASVESAIENKTDSELQEEVDE